MKKMLFVMNPYSGMRKASRYLAEIIEIFNRADYEVIVHMTAGHGDATKIVESRCRGMDLVVCCGGDGTLNETISGILRAGEKIPVGYLPAGSTNDLATSLKISSNVLQAATDIVEGQPMPYDVGRFGDRFFAYVASFGAFTKTSYTTPQSLKNMLGHTAYVLEGINELSQIKNEHVRMELDGQVIEDDFLFGAISNSTSVGGILTLSPEIVDMADGEFEVILVRAARNLTEIAECVQAVQSQKYSCSMITFQRAKHIRIFAAPQMPWTLDGEREEGHEQVDACNMHHAVMLMKRVEENA